MSIETQVNWQALMTAALVPPAERVRDALEWTRGEPRRRLATSAELAECECPESCLRDHEND